jgi:hypothetical protein
MYGRPPQAKRGGEAAAGGGAAAQQKEAKAHPGVTAAGAGGGVPSATGWQKMPAPKGKKKKGKGGQADDGVPGLEAPSPYEVLNR